MLKLAHVITAVAAAALLIACTAPTDPSTDEPTADPADETATEVTASELESSDDASPAYHPRYNDCDRRDFWRCSRRQRGWRWVELPRDHRYDRRQRCCMREERPIHPHF